MISNLSLSLSLSLYLSLSIYLSLSLPPTADYKPNFYIDSEILSDEQITLVSQMLEMYGDRGGSITEFQDFHFTDV